VTEFSYRSESAPAWHRSLTVAALQVARVTLSIWHIRFNNQVDQIPTKWDQVDQVLGFAEGLSVFIRGKNYYRRASASIRGERAKRVEPSAVE
jgi:hypothetical protein